MIYFGILVWALSHLGSDEYSERELANRILDNPVGHSILPINDPNPEVRWRVDQMLVSDEVRLYRKDIEKWFWEYPFEGRSKLFNDMELRVKFCVDRRMDIVRDIMEQPWGKQIFLHGSVFANEELRMRYFFDSINNVGKARMAVTGFPRIW